MKCQITKRMVPTLGFLCLLAACASYSVKEAPITKPEAMPYTRTEAMVVVGVDPYVDPDKAQALFGEDLLAAEVIPLQIVVRNQGESPVRIEVKNFKLGLPGGDVVAPQPGLEVAALFDTKGGFMDYAPIGIGLLGRLGGMIGGLAATVVGGMVSGSVKGSQKNVSLARLQDYTRKELKSVALSRNESTRGFLFFSPPAGTAAFDEATLILEIYEKDARTTNIKVPLKGLGYKVEPATDK